MAQLPCLVLECRQLMPEADRQEVKAATQRIRVFTFCPIVLSRGGGCAGRRIKLVVVCHCDATHEAVDEFRCDYQELCDDVLMADVLSVAAGSEPAGCNHPLQQQGQDPVAQREALKAQERNEDEDIEVEPASKGIKNAQQIAQVKTGELLCSRTSSDVTHPESPSVSPVNSFLNFGVHGLGVSMTSDRLRDVLDTEVADSKLKDTASPGAEWHENDDEGRNHGAEFAVRGRKDTALPADSWLEGCEEKDKQSGDVEAARRDSSSLRESLTSDLITETSVPVPETQVLKMADDVDALQEEAAELAGLAEGKHLGPNEVDEASEAEAAVKAVEAQALREYSTQHLRESESDEGTEDGSPERNLDDFTDSDEGSEGGGSCGGVNEFESSYNSKSGQAMRAESRHQSSVDVYRQYPFSQIYSVNRQNAEPAKQQHPQQQKPAESHDSSQGNTDTRDKCGCVQQRLDLLENYLHATAAATATAHTRGAGNQGATESKLHLLIKQTQPASVPEMPSGTAASTSSSDGSQVVRIGSYDSLSSAQSRIFYEAAADQKRQQQHAGQSMQKSVSDEAASHDCVWKTYVAQHKAATAAASGECQCFKPVQSALVLMQQSVTALSTSAAAVAAVTTAWLTPTALTTACPPQIRLGPLAQRAAVHRSHGCDSRQQQRHHQQKQNRQQSNFAKDSPPSHGGRRIRRSLNRVLNWDCSSDRGRGFRKVHREAAVHHLLQPTESLLAIYSDVDSAA